MNDVVGVDIRLVIPGPTGHAIAALLRLAASRLEDIVAFPPEHDVVALRAKEEVPAALTQEAVGARAPVDDPGQRVLVAPAADEPVSAVPAAELVEIALPGDRVVAGTGVDDVPLLGADDRVGLVGPVAVGPVPAAVDRGAPGNRCAQARDGRDRGSHQKLS